MRQHKVVVVEAALLPHIHGEVAIAVLGPQRLLDPLLPGGLLDGLLVMGLGGDAAAHGERRGGAGFAADAFSSGDEIDEDAVVELGEADPVSRKRRKEKEKKKRRKEKRKQRKWAPPDKDEGSFGTVYSADLGGGRTDLGMKRLDASETGDACCGS
ncbi:hypothetical protein OsJ_36412 [Oryza sativa Japonica Group]|uniref:Uncharacterized protein n=1 Tax=Oryza sativa subsp. japonica TaxID=39947 RepID=B9GDL5_ORYSJ|nr:hypothetical protein OsJ_36412 [Oryza sativa Japonica Group]